MVTETREKIVATTVEMLRDCEIHSLRVSALAQKASVAVPTIYYHYRSVSDVVVEATIVTLQDFLRAFNAIQEEMRTAIERDDKHFFLRSLQQFIDRSWSQATALEVHRIEPLIAHFRTVARGDSRMRSIQVKVVSDLTEILQGALAKGWLVDDIDLNAFVVLHWTAVLGQALFWHPSFGPLTAVERDSAGYHLRFRTSLTGDIRRFPLA